MLLHCCSLTKLLSLAVAEFSRVLKPNQELLAPRAPAVFSGRTLVDSLHFVLGLKVGAGRGFHLSATAYLVNRQLLCPAAPGLALGLRFLPIYCSSREDLKIETRIVLSPLNGNANNSKASLFGGHSRLLGAREQRTLGCSNQIIKFLQGLLQLFRTCFIFWDSSGRKQIRNCFVTAGVEGGGWGGLCLI